MHDLVIRGGTVVDGTGAPARTADVAVDDGRISEVGDRSGAQPPATTIDADGLLVTPGWVDIHTHFDGQATWDDGAGPQRLARRDHGGHGQLRCRVRAGPTRSSRLAHRSDGRRRGHPRHRPGRGHDVELGELPRVPRRARPPRAGPSTSAPRSPTARCAPTSWVSAARATSRPIADDIAEMKAVVKAAIRAGALGLLDLAHARPPRHRRRAGAGHLRGRGRAVRHRLGPGRARHRRVRAGPDGLGRRGHHRSGQGGRLDAAAVGRHRPAGHLRAAPGRRRARTCGAS